MSRGLAATAATIAFAVVAAAAAPCGRGAVVTLEVESATAPAPLFDAPVSTSPHAVDGGDGSGPHPCWGPPGATPTATATGALDDALREGSLTWRGNWDPSFGDFFVDRIGAFSSAPPNDYWSLTVNGAFSAGGCLTRVADGDTVRFFYGPLFESPAGGPGGGGGSQPGGGPPAKPGSGPGAASPHAQTRRLRRVATGAARYLRRSEGAGVGWARLALALRGRGRPARAAAALIAGQGHRRPDGSLGDDVNATALSILAVAPGRTRARAATWLAAQQQPTGGFGYRPGAAADVDTTGLAAWALAVAGGQEACRRAAAFVRASQAPDGGFPAIPGGSSNAQSTGFGLVALRVAGLGPRSATTAGGRTALDYLAGLSRRDGAVAYAPGSSPTPLWTTSQALLGLTARSKLLAFAAGGSRGRIR